MMLHRYAVAATHSGAQMLHRNFALPVSALVLSLFAATAAAALPQRTFVASTGNDANPCSITLPCRGFAAALAHTASGGEIIVLDSAGYGPVAIAQSVSINAPAGVYAGITVSSGDGIIVNAAGGNVVLRGLTINGQGGNSGIRVLDVGELFVEDCTVANLTMDGIRVEGGTTVHIVRADVHSNDPAGLHVVSGTPVVEVSDSRFVQNGSSGIFIEAGEFNGSHVTVDHNFGPPGFFVQLSAAGTVNVTLTDSVLTSNTWGFVGYAPSAGMTVNAALTRVTTRHNSISGIQIDAGTGGTATAVIADSHAVDNAANGVSAVNGATVIVSGTTAAGNGGADLNQSSSVMRTAGNNALTGRGAPDVSGILTANPPK